MPNFGVHTFPIEPGRIMEKPRITTLVLDLDNTLWDWFEIWYQTFSAMLGKIAEISGIPEEELCRHIKPIHQKHGTAEYAFLLEELDILQKEGETLEELLARFQPAIEAFRVARRRELKLYPTVRETLEGIRSTGCQVLAYTESKAFYTSYRLRKLDMDGLIDVLYSPADHDLPEGLTAEQVRRYPKDHYQLQKTHHRHTPAGEAKPNPDVLRTILRDADATQSHTAYVGDSEMKDIAMAQACNVHDVHAAYGKFQDRPEYDLLRAVTFWPDRDVAQERVVIETPHVVPSYVLHEEFGEILSLFDFSR